MIEATAVRTLPDNILGIAHGVSINAVLRGIGRRLWLLQPCRLIFEFSQAHR